MATTLKKTSEVKMLKKPSPKKKVSTATAKEATTAANQKKTMKKPTPKSGSGTTKPALKKAKMAAPAPAVDEYGLKTGSDVSFVLKECVKGGSSKEDVIARVTTMTADKTTKSGKPKPWSTVVNQVIAQMVPRGFTVESTFRLVPPPEGKLKPPIKKRQPAQETVEQPKKKVPGLKKPTRKAVEASEKTKPTKTAPPKKKAATTVTKPSPKRKTTKK